MKNICIFYFIIAKQFTKQITKYIIGFIRVLENRYRVWLSNSVLFVATVVFVLDLELVSQVPTYPTKPRNVLV